MSSFYATKNSLTLELELYVFCFWWQYVLNIPTRFKQYVSGRKLFQKTWPLFLCLPLTLTSTLKPVLVGQGQTLNRKNEMSKECESSYGSDKASPHFFNSNISTFGSLQGKGYQQILLEHRKMIYCTCLLKASIPDNIPSSKMWQAVDILQDFMLQND